MIIIIIVKSGLKKKKQVQFIFIT